MALHSILGAIGGALGMEAFKSSAPDFYAAYFTARMIIDRSGTHKPAKPTTPPTP